MTEETLTRYRISFTKGAHLRYIGHLDLHRTMERTLRRAKLPLGYSKGFNPRVKLNLSTALPLGCSSKAELADIWLATARDETLVLESLCKSAPPGMTFTHIEKIDLRTPSLQSQIQACEYQVELSNLREPSTLSKNVAALLETERLPRTRRGKDYDLRPLIQSLQLFEDERDTSILQMVLSVGERSTGRPEEVLLALDLDPTECLIERTKLFLAAETSTEK
jgi:radical SAM-linked protein